LIISKAQKIVNGKNIKGVEDFFACHFLDQASLDAVYRYFLNGQ
jgi:hypothetical protein